MVRKTQRDRPETRERPEETREVRTSEEERVPLHEQRDIMSAPTKEGFVRRWVNETDRYGSRIARFQKAGWSPVTDNLPVGAEAVTDHNDSLGSHVRKNVGNGMHAILMEIAQEYFDADQAVKADADTRKEESIKRTLGGFRDETVYGETTTEVTRGKLRQQKGHGVS